MSYDVFAELATNNDLEENGTWQPLGKGAELLIARANNRAYTKLLQKQVEANKHVLDLEDDAAEAKSDEIMIDVIARTVLLGWKKLAFQGAELSYSVDNAKRVLAVKEFRNRVMGLANNFEAYKAKQELVQGNV